MTRGFKRGMARSVALLLASVTLAIAGCGGREDDLKNLPGPDGLLPDGSPPRAAAPAAPDSGTYNSSVNRNPRPPLSGINSDPANPSGAPGSSSR